MSDACECYDKAVAEGERITYYIALERKGAEPVTIEEGGRGLGFSAWWVDNERFVYWNEGALICMICGETGGLC